jgi:hypothetical protein
MRRLMPLVGPGCLVALLLACYGSVLLKHEQFAYRDSAHFYYPLYQVVQQEWAAGRVPLWEVGENAGMPLLGNPTAAVLYPGKLIFAPFSYPWGARLYVVAHTLLAVFGMYALLRSWGVSLTGSGLAALGYGFGAPILFQYCNIIFLVGAAWTPLGLRAVDRWLRLGRRGALAELAVILALQSLGGDPQSAYVTGLCAGGYALGLAGRGAKVHPARPRRVALWGAILLVAWIAATLAAARLALVTRPARLLNPAVLPGQGGPPRAEWRAWGLLIPPVLWAVAALGVATSLVRRWRRGGVPAWAPRLGGLAAAGALAVAMSAAQLLPVLEYSSRSLRGAAEAPHDIYPFSLAPYRVVEMAWPNAFGTTFRGNRSFLGFLPPRENHRIWVPSLYLGGLTLVLAMAALGWRDGPAWRAWLTAIAAISLVASLGEFASPLWAARWDPAWAAWLGPHDPPDVAPTRFDGCLRDGDGSPYWIMAMFLPGFGQFRYPSKLLSFTCLALAALAGIGWDRVAAGRRGRAVVAASLMVVLSLAALGGVRAAAGRILQLTKDGPPAKTTFGPLDAKGALCDVQWALAQGAVIAAGALGVALLAGRRPRLAGAAALVLTTADLAVANAQLVITMPQAAFEERPKALQIIEQAERADPSPGPFRVHREPLWSPLSWVLVPSTDRPAEFVRFERATIQPKYALPYGLQYTLSEGVTELYDYWWFFGSFYRRLDPQLARELGAKPQSLIVYQPRRGFDLWNTRYFVLPGVPQWHDEHRGIAAFLPNTEKIYPPPGAFEGPGGKERQQRWIDEEDVQILRNKAAYPRAWVVHKARYLKPIRGFSREDRQAPMEEILFQNDPFWQDPDRLLFDPHEIAWVEAEDRDDVAAVMPQTPPDPAEHVAVGPYDDPQRVELDAVLNRPGLVILADVYYPGWRLTIDGRPAPIYRVNRLMRGALVESGRHRLVYTYQPDSFARGASITAVALLTLLGFGAWASRRPLAPWSVKDRAPEGPGDA